MLCVKSSFCCLLLPAVLSFWEGRLKMRRDLCSAGCLKCCDKTIRSVVASKTVVLSSNLADCLLWKKSINGWQEIFFWQGLIKNRQQKVKTGTQLKFSAPLCHPWQLMFTLNNFPQQGGKYYRIFFKKLFFLRNEVVEKKICLGSKYWKKTEKPVVSSRLERSLVHPLMTGKYNDFGQRKITPKIKSSHASKCDRVRLDQRLTGKLSRHSLQKIVFQMPMENQIINHHHLPTISMDHCPWKKIQRFISVIFSGDPA